MAKMRGLPQLMKALDDVQKKAEKNQGIALSLIGNEYANDTKAITPWITHTLLRSIHVEPTSGTFKKGNGEQFVVVGTDVKYARRVEYGFADKDKLGRIYNQAPHPYFRPALDNNQNKYRRMFMEGMTR